MLMPYLIKSWNKSIQETIALALSKNHPFVQFSIFTDLNLSGCFLFSIRFYQQFL